MVFTWIRNVQLVIQQTNYHQREGNRDRLDGIFILFLLTCCFPSMIWPMSRSEITLCISAGFSRPDPATVPSSQLCDWLPVWWQATRIKYNKKNADFLLSNFNGSWFCKEGSKGISPITETLVSAALLMGVLQFVWRELKSS